MLRPWRRAAVAALAGAAALAAQLSVIAPAQAAAPTITIFATGKLPPVTHDVLVFYKGSGGFASAKIHGKITGAAVGEVAALYAQQFPYKTRPVRLGAITLKSSAPVYSFTVTPALATRYAVRLFASGTSKTPLASSAAVNVYVSLNGFTTGGGNCSRPVCHQVLHEFTVVPGSALRTEMGKHQYLYFGLSLSPTSEPPPPHWLYLNAGHPTQTKSRRVNAGEYETTITFTFTIGNDGWYWLWSSCVKDTESKDGVGLPGHHGCGTLSRIPSNSFVYLG
jgi:hypothetical protein